MKLSRLLTSVATMLLGFTSLAQAQTWTELGPAPLSNDFTGRISSIVCSPTDANCYYVGGADGGVWKTTDGGASWTPLTGHMPTTSIGSLALDPNDESVIYAGTGEPNYANHSRYGLGMYKSVDAGTTWTVMGRGAFGGRCISTIVVDHTDSQVIYASVTRAGGFPELAAAKEHPGATGNLGVFKSADGGQSWSRLTNLPNVSASALVMDPTDSSILYAAIGRIYGSPDNGIYKTTNSGSTWSKLSGGLPNSDVGRIALAIAPSLPNRLYALVTEVSDSSGGSASTNGAWRTDNGGNSWSSVSPGSIQASYGWYLCVTAVSPTDPDTVFMGGLSLKRSTNKGSSYSTVTPPHVDMHALAFDASGRLLVGDDGGVHRSTNNGSSWSDLNSGLATIQFYAGLSADPNDDNVIFGGTQDNGSNQRETDSKEWTHVFGGDGGWTQIDPSDSQRVFVEFQGTGNIYRSTNGGSSFSYIGSGINSGDRNCFLPPFLIDPSNPSRIIYATHRIYESTNGGSGWNAISGDLTNGGAIRAIAMAPSNSDVIYAATNDGNFQASTDGGSNFTLQLTNRPGWPRVTREITVHPTNEEIVYLATAAFDADQVTRATDGGFTWTSLDGDLPNTPVNVVAVDASTNPPTLYAGTDQGVFRSRNDGEHWQIHGNGLPRVPVIDLRLELDRRRLIAGTQGRGAWSIPVYYDVGVTPGAAK